MQSHKEGGLLQPVDDVTYAPKQRSTCTRERVVAFVVLLVGVVLLIIGIALIAASKTSSDEEKKKSTDNSCFYSDEAKRVDLGGFLDHVRRTYFQLHPYDIFHNPELQTRDQARKGFSVYDPSPSVIKTQTDTTLKLLKEIEPKKINVDILKPRERKSLAQVKHYLTHIFGDPYEVNYYTGDWMLGPNSFCWQPICIIVNHVYNMLMYFEPTNLSQMEFLLKTIKKFESAFDRYVENMKLGVTKGMVRSKEECKAGYDALSRTYFKISLHNESGILKEWFTNRVTSNDYYKSISVSDQEKWQSMHNKNVSESVNEYLIEYIGKPVVRLLRYYKGDHLSHCVPSAVSSGLAGLPVKYVYTNGVPDKSKPTDPTLPLTDMVLNGSKAYEMIMPYFTTNDMTPDQVHQLGWDMLNKLYPKVVKIAKQITKIDNDSAVEEFRNVLNSSEMYFNDPIPHNESDAQAHRLCSDIEGAKKHCPQRWKGMQMWFKEAREAMSKLNPKTVDMFYFTGPKRTTPSCPIDLRPNLNPSSGAQSYEPSNKKCTNNAMYNIPFFLGRMGPKYSEWSVNAHEARPGHHLQVQGAIENFDDSCGGSIGWLNRESYYTAFTEGWALYAENPLISEDTDTYDNHLMQQFGMLKWQIWRALRLIVDTGLHYKGMTRAEALKMFDEKAWDGTDLVEKEITRYQSNPGQATAYMIGQLDIKKARHYATSKLDKDFDLKDFHYQVLSQGSSPLGYLSDHIKRYVECKKDPKKEGCTEILEPPQKPAKTAQVKAKRRKLPLPLRPRRTHYI